MRKKFKAIFLVVIGVLALMGGYTFIAGGPFGLLHPAWLHGPEQSQRTKRHEREPLLHRPAKGASKEFFQ